MKPKPTPAQKAEMDARLLVAMKVARHHHLTHWNNELKRHRRHKSFQLRTFAWTREYGFACSCTGTEQELRTSIIPIKEMLPEARESLLRLYSKHVDKERRDLDRQRHPAEMKGKALLKRFLTKAQRVEFRKTNAFKMKGKDGHSYVIARSSLVVTEREGEEYGLCVMAKDWIPTYDTMLAQKVMLETQPEEFIRMAHVSNVGTHEVYGSGEFLINGRKPPKVEKLRTWQLVPMTDEQIENPREWVVARCRD